MMNDFINANQFVGMTTTTSTTIFAGWDI
ncbi:Protein of unknown function [Weissella confusa LBAE C39-2]|jgi:hypothetical protein|nr:Protein of unknown function [Weissella confusa LBAE C39-2]